MTFEGPFQYKLLYDSMKVVPKHAPINEEKF